MKKILFPMLMAMALACGDDDGGTDKTDAAATSDGLVTVDSGADNDSGTTADAAATDVAFCTGYGTKCTFGGESRYEDDADCLTAFNGFDSTTQACVVEHLGLAADSEDVHCDHAHGEGPCAP